MKVPAVLLRVFLYIIAADLYVGIVGTDTSHATAFTRILNDPNDAGPTAYNLQPSAVTTYRPA